VTEWCPDCDAPFDGDACPCGWRPIQAVSLASYEQVVQQRDQLLEAVKRQRERNEADLLDLTDADRQLYEAAESIERGEGV
jgi:predicted amidophosphoribosyltransferase